MTTEAHITSHRDGATLNVTVQTPVLTSLESPLVGDAIVDLMHQAAPDLRAIVVDLRAVSTINSVALGMLITIHTTATNRGVRIVLTGVSPFIRDVLSKTKLDRVLPVCDTAEALEEELRI